VCCGWLPPEDAVLPETLTREAAALHIGLFRADARQSAGPLLSDAPGRSWRGPAIHVALQVVERLRATSAFVVDPLTVSSSADGVGQGAKPAGPARPRFRALTTSSNPFDTLHRDLVGYETDPYPGAGDEEPLTVGWRLLPGSMATDIAAGVDGSLWALGALPCHGGYPLFRWTWEGWLPANAGGVAVAVDAEGHPWIVDAFGTLLQWGGSDWREVRREAHDVVIAHDGGVWVLAGSRTAHGYQVLHRPGDATGDRRSDWHTLEPRAERIAVAPDGAPWIVTPAGEAKRYDGQDWTVQARNVRDVALGPHGEVWVVSQRSGRIYRRRRDAGGWQRADGVANRIVALPEGIAQGMLWAITPAGLVAIGYVVDIAGGQAA